ncbi:MAG: CocE/NonD family hydrolase [Pseudanabaena sp.]|jgi:putative CocE/NonD family hydrolase|uniref:CocE/NonD family hydrolase n=1 Tax=Pseudanabaena mucicola TaxID=71190 RepID=UPI0025785AD7|nr:CocE/NonD family hydrolase [Pseudanabaena mucicola]MCA6571739.1 CocE/NonD family hydrolase [Pseudanabaena sp. M53BS1SP1A06MG]MCA6584396.1 CocE/NonD family hydrolase [Pseudanabaena sp. M34BS1SP1A06MG]MCA6591956.1 CocE/NonD family hydrolase [Pseudanabaena sp. M38BS1SP1A06MG]MCA6598947.1 CocE/NonD family hydrolase [Pseudanabaena sp. M57BS1SP1A06MG]MCE2977594.1 CocE/NonD family hydrolase [Pseudanabaena sp. CoA8_M7]
MPPKLTSFHFKVDVQRQVKIPMRDRCNLTADIYRPKGVNTPLPVLLMRLPYGRAIASTCTYAHPSWYAHQGYIVVIQDVRGCGTSDGEFYPFRNEYEDGFDTVEWCAKKLDGSNGRIGMYGFSYQGVTQFQAAVQQPEGLVTICPSMATADLYHGWFYFGGAVCLDFDINWALQLAQNRAWYLKQEPQATKLFEAQKQSARWLESAPLSEIALFKNPDFGDFGKFFFDWIGNQQANDEYWQKLNPLSYFDRYDLPALHIAGWADIFIEATINTYHQAKSATKKPQHLIVAPWQHLPWLPKVGELDFGENAVSKIDQLQIDWFDFWLKEIDNGISDRSPIQLFLMGKNHWLDLPEFPQSSIIQNLYLASNKQLTPQSPINNHQLPDIYVYDPRNPNPSTNYGFYDQRNVHQRWDVMVYQSDELDEDLAIAGIPQFILYAATTAPDTDWVIKLLDIYPDGRQMLVSMGVLRTKFRNSWTEPEWIESDVVNKYLIDLRPTCQNFAKGHRIGIAISSSAFPIIERHSNTKKLPSEATISDFVEAIQQIFYGMEYPSHLQLPIC